VVGQLACSTYVSLPKLPESHFVFPLPRTGQAETAGLAVLPYCRVHNFNDATSFLNSPEVVMELNFSPLLV
jgi:hypothetical protein